MTLVKAISYALMLLAGIAIGTCGGCSLGLATDSMSRWSEWWLWGGGIVGITVTGLCLRGKEARDAAGAALAGAAKAPAETPALDPTDPTDQSDPPNPSEKA